MYLLIKLNISFSHFVVIHKSSFLLKVVLTPTEADEFWLYPMFDLVKVACFEQRGVHHPPDLLRQSHHQLEAAEKEADPADDHDGPDNN